MAYTDLNDQSLPDVIGRGLLAVAGGFYEATLSGNLTLTAEYPLVIRLDPDGSNRDVTLEAEATSSGMFRMIVNAANGAEDLVIKNDGGSTIATANQNEAALVYCDGTDWRLACLFTAPAS